MVIGYLRFPPIGDNFTAYIEYCYNGTVGKYIYIFLIIKCFFLVSLVKITK